MLFFKTPSLLGVKDLNTSRRVMRPIGLECREEAYYILTPADCTFYLHVTKGGYVFGCVYLFVFRFVHMITYKAMNGFA